jgi:SpoVK/Ycf46/Vps4 family AAA+-type ATPase
MQGIPPRLPPPKGLLIIGAAGTDKSLAGKTTAGVFGAPLLRLDAGRLFAGLVGQSEANLRSVKRRKDPSGASVPVPVH